MNLSVHRFWYQGKSWNQFSGETEGNLNLGRDIKKYMQILDCVGVSIPNPSYSRVNCNQQLYQKVYCVMDNFLNALHVLTLLIFLIILPRHYFPHFKKGEQIEFQLLAQSHKAKKWWIQGSNIDYQIPMIPYSVHTYLNIINNLANSEQKKNHFTACMMLFVPFCKMVLLYILMLCRFI